MVSTEKTSFVVVLSTLFLVVSRTHAAFLRSRAYTTSTQCEIKVLDKLQDSFDEQGDDVDFECVMDPMDMHGVSGMTLPIQATEKQRDTLKQMLENNMLIPGRSVLRHGSILFSNKGIFLPADFDIQENVITEVRADGRMLEAYVTATGNKNILVVKVTDKNGKVVPDSLQTIADNVFGTSGDSNTLKSVLEGCSMGKMTVTPGLVPPGTISQPYAGVIEVTVDLDVTTAARNDFRNAITAKVNELLGISLPGPYDHVMYSIACEGGSDCGYVAYAYDNDWNSVYYNQFYSMPSVQAHEVAHNFNLHHSRGLDLGERSDHTGLMGNPLFQDDDSKICFNAAKNWQLSSNGNNWYSDRKLLIDPQSWSNGNDFSHTFQMVGVADYENAPEGHYVVVKLETRMSIDFFIGLNIAKGVNENTVQARNQVTVLQADGNGETFKRSDMKAHLFQGESYTIDTFGSTEKPLEVIVRKIDLRTSPQVAEIEIRYGNDAPPSQPLECNDVLLSIYTDNYPTETSWKLFNNGYGMEMTTGGGYTAANTLHDQILCLEDGDYEFVIEDQYGDGMCCGYGNGYWKLIFDGSTLLEGAEFGSSLTDTFTVSSGSSSESPSSIPTLNPSAIPSFSSSDGPSTLPSSRPTAGPSSHPSDLPSSVPSNTPSLESSSLPSAGPSSLPSEYPSMSSNKPSSSPFASPSAAPSFGSNMPTFKSTPAPTSFPTTTITSAPTTAPVIGVTKSPSSSPSTLPTISTTSSPTKSTSSPTAAPSASPTTSPTNSPTSSPSTAPTNAPTAANTINCTLVNDKDCDDYPECKIWGKKRDEFCGFVNQCEPFEGESCKYLPCCEGLVCSGGKKAKCELP